LKTNKPASRRQTVTRRGDGTRNAEG
jgi:hypothetical protein